MPPDQADKQPQLHQDQDDHGQRLIQVAPREEDVGHAAGPDLQFNLHKHHHPEEPQSQGTAQRTKLPNDTKTPSHESIVLLTIEGYRELNEVVDRLIKSVTETRQSLEEVTALREAEYNEHQATEQKLSNITKCFSDARRGWTTKTEDLNNRIKHLNTVRMNMDACLLTRDQTIKTQCEENEATKLQLSELKDECEVWRRSHDSICDQLRDKGRLIEANREEQAGLRRELEAVLTQVEGTKRECSSAKKQIHDLGNVLAETQEKLRTRDQQLDDTERKLEEAERQIDALQIVNDKNGAHNTKIRAGLEKSQATLSKERKEHKKTEASLKKEKSRFEAQYEDLQQEVQEMESEWNEQKKDLVRKLRESRGHNHRYIDKTPDNEVKGKFGELRFKIGQFINNYLEEVTNAVCQELEPVWTELTPNARQFLESTILRSMIFEAYIWNWLRRTVFAPESAVWAGDLGTMFSQVLGKAKKHLKGPKNDPGLYADYQYWRSSSSIFLSRLNDRSYSSEVCRPDVQTMVTELSHICGSFNLDSATADALEIFNDARGLDTTLRTLKAKFLWVFGKMDQNELLIQRSGFTLDNCMCDRFRNRNNSAVEEAPTVDLVISPGLLKRGNNDGADYCAARYCIKMDVVCNASERFPGETKTFVDAQAYAFSPKQEVGNPDAMQAIKEEDMIEIVEPAPFRSHSMCLGFEPESNHDDITLHPDTPGGTKVSTFTRGMNSGQESNFASDTGAYSELTTHRLPPNKTSSGTKAGGSGRKMAKEHESDIEIFDEEDDDTSVSDGCDDEKDGDYRP